MNATNCNNTLLVLLHFSHYMILLLSLANTNFSKGEQFVSFYTFSNYLEFSQ